MLKCTGGLSSACQHCVFHTQKSTWRKLRLNSIRDEWPEKAVSNNPVRRKTPLKERCHGYENKRHRRSKRRKIASIFLYLSIGGHKDTRVTGAVQVWLVSIGSCPLRFFVSKGNLVRRQMYCISNCSGTYCMCSHKHALSKIQWLTSAINIAMSCLSGEMTSFLLAVLIIMGVTLAVMLNSAAVPDVCLSTIEEDGSYFSFQFKSQCTS